MITVDEGKVGDEVLVDESKVGNEVTVDESKVGNEVPVDESKVVNEVFVLFVCAAVQRLFHIISIILRPHPHETSYSVAKLERPCRKHLTRAPRPVTL